MILDSSALVAVLREENDHETLNDAILDASSVKMSAANYLETAIVIDGWKNQVTSSRLDSFVREARIEIVPVTGDDVQIARRAHRAYGRGSGHPARLNFGDCFAYALAKTSGEPLLFKGDDFTHTDVEPALK